MCTSSQYFNAMYVYIYSSPFRLNHNKNQDFYLFIDGFDIINEHFI